MRIQTNGIKMKLMLVTILLSLGMTCMLLLFFWNNTKRAERERSLEESYNRLSVAAINLEKDITQIWNFLNSFSSNAQVDRYLSMSQSKMDSRLWYGEGVRSEAGSLMTKTYDEINRMMIQYGLVDVVAKCVLTSRSHDGELILGGVNGHPSDVQRLLSMFEEGEDERYAGIVEADFYYGYQKDLHYVLPLHAPVYAYNGTEKIGDVYVALNAEWMEQQFGLYTKEDAILLSVNDKVYAYQEGSFLEQPASLLALLEMAQTVGEETVRSVSWEGEQYVVVRGNSALFSFAQKIPPYTLNWGKMQIGSELFACLGAMLVMMGILYAFLNYMIKRPVTKICSQFQQIAQGNFSGLEKLESNDEFQLISEEMIRMAGELKQLMEKTVEDEKVKQNYQFQMLQYQINPHFMYNTLNSIRWMGEINGIPGIVDMTTSFAKLLRKTFQNHSDFVTLKEELDFIEEYSKLQAYRYGNAFEMKYEVEESLYPTKVIKFTLEPLVENAVFHGVEASHSKCLIRIGARREGEDLLLFVWDNGVGIAEENLKKLNAFQAGKKDRISGIGISNVHERIQMEYGRDYGVHIDSKVGEYTCVTIRQPFLLLKGGEAAELRTEK
ncbi:MAG: sensor histidine kinase [bacterium]|nr:sensor histidine kinase [bacterium]